MKSKIQTYGKMVIFLLAGMLIFLAAACILPWIDDLEIELLFRAFTNLCNACGVILGLTIARYGARETAVSLKGNYPEKKEGIDDL